MNLQGYEKQGSNEVKKAVRFLTETVTRENGFTHMSIDNLNIVIQYVNNVGRLRKDAGMSLEAHKENYEKWKKSRNLY
ncbi:hypothetical protein ABER98_18805 [Domibacillus aminovorans]|uniref:hypothetical protein n=1 Tax=Domibacillus aminovorans TaxID=29332 RepID=UPI003D1BBB4E